MPGLVGRVHPVELGRDPVGDVADRRQHALAAVAGLVAVAQLDRLVGAGRRAGRHGRPPDRAVAEDDVDLDRGVAARIEDLAGIDELDDRVHALAPALAFFDFGAGSGAGRSWRTAIPGQLATLEELERCAAAGADVGHLGGQPLLLDRGHAVAAADHDRRPVLGLVGEEAGDRLRAVGERRDLEDAERSVPEDGLHVGQGLLDRGPALLAHVHDVPGRRELLGADRLVLGRRG